MRHPPLRAVVLGLAGLALAVEGLRRLERLSIKRTIPLLAKEIPKQKPEFGQEENPDNT